jgi:hypothetical protein
MNMSEFEEQPLESNEDSCDLSFHGKTLPDDFSADEAEFARELEDLFAFDQENIPPLFVQTLMASEDARFEAVEHRFESKTSARVFRRLKLKRYLFHRHASMNMLTSFFSVPRSLVKFGFAAFFFMFATMVMAGPSFASGLSYLWSGPHSGVVQLDSYPRVSSSNALPSIQEPHSSDAQSQTMDLLGAQKILHFPMFWPQYMPSRYQPSDIYLYPGDSSWSDGPVLVLNYSYALPGVDPRQITICEFKPNGTVLQVVHNGAAHLIRMGLGGAGSGVYITGQWTQQSLTATPSWTYTHRSELIFEDPDTGVVFWIVGDKRDGIDENELSNIATSLHIFDVRSMHMAEQFSKVTQGESDTPWLFADDVIYLQNANSPDGPKFQLLGNDPPSHNFDKN